MNEVLISAIRFIITYRKAIAISIAMMALFMAGVRFEHNRLTNFYEDKIENIKDAYKRNKKPKKKIFLDGQYFDNLEKKQEYFKNKYKKKLQDKDDDLIFLSNLDEETQINIYNIIKHLELLPFDEDMGRDYTYLTKLLNGGNMDKHILKDILVSYNTYL